MFAGTIVAPMKPDKWDDLVSIYGDSSRSHVGGPEGMKAAYLPRVPGSNEGMSVVSYDNEAQAKPSAEPGGLFVEIVPKLAECFAGRPVRNISEVIAAIELTIRRRYPSKKRGSRYSPTRSLLGRRALSQGAVSSGSAVAADDDEGSDGHEHGPA